MLTYRVDGTWGNGRVEIQRRLTLRGLELYRQARNVGYVDVYAAGHHVGRLDVMALTCSDENFVTMELRAEKAAMVAFFTRNRLGKLYTLQGVERDGALAFDLINTTTWEKENGIEAVTHYAPSIKRYQQCKDWDHQKPLGHVIANASPTAWVIWFHGHPSLLVRYHEEGTLTELRCRDDGWEYHSNVTANVIMDERCQAVTKSEGMDLCIAHAELSMYHP